MNITINRYISNKDCTIGKMYIDDNFECYTLEDEERTQKVWGETRIPAGTYEIKLRTTGGFHQRYTAKFGVNFHKGMLWLQDVPGFEYILIHIGNDDDDTAGCILVGETSNNKDFIGGSTNAYKQLYPKVRDSLLKGGEVCLTIIDED